MAAGETPLDVAHRIAPPPRTRDEATTGAWVRHYAAQALAAHVMFRTESAILPVSWSPGSRPEAGYLALLAGAATAVVAALTAPVNAGDLMWDLSPDGALNGEGEELLVDILGRHGVNPGYIDPANWDNPVTGEPALPARQPDRWEYGRYDPDEGRVIRYDGTPRLITSRVLRRPLAAIGPWEPADKTEEGRL